ncbi:MAG: hypothetical protein HLUCCA11_19955 [Phormidesmis priestleyi Ana]|uniref:Uncharacterized protein n=1 Tax=Phormidesmis priestleyi Ana TaxID=1666911 RepID=A0A0P7ZJA1_9CYAN|nr:MAG: hypothetical protein HLUCCA11_19955 [Phormidesmis priestleyi Ana]
MKKIVSSAIIQLRRLLVVGLVSLSLWSAALVAPAQAADTNDYYTNDRGSLQTTERYDQIQPKAGGMNEFDDVDPRRDTKAAEAKAKELTSSTKRIQSRPSDPLEPARETIGGIKENIKGAASDLLD